MTTKTFWYKDQNISLKDQNVSLKDQNVSLKNQNVLRKNQNVLLKNRNVLLKDQNVSLKNRKIFFLTTYVVRKKKTVRSASYKNCLLSFNGIPTPSLPFRSLRLGNPENRRTQERTSRKPMM
jgi:hypothetical protein